ncbi:MotA/TolQ/ExbB proton channel family protein [Pontiella agarivorans]|uniref:MotA/TolQ/ExbB proton channel family protein n=1 Tax=Pontiella agarivorans TaxID=3038953 RepID=A0ABU5MXL8_9BACT|nr:MotA/TolQ/ExbB proton channel family protein [Pontiella agarivorans]MDZ8118907.1 MotA/TolQ/ExbB proton channel family protein [Pontiella agarivorans]
MQNFDTLLLSLPIADVSSAFWDSTLPGKAITILLFLGSAMAWTIMYTKGVQLRMAGRTTAYFLEAFRSSKKNPTALYAREEEYPATPLNEIYLAGCEALGDELAARGIDPDDALMSETSSELHRRLTLNQLETIRSVVDRHVADEALKLEEQMGMLATAVSAAPFLGLLGTVWGVMDAFSGMAISGSAALSAVAPGISGALLTTIVGLIVALPSMVGYNLLSAQIRRISVQMDNFAQEFTSEIQNMYVIEG